MVFPSGVLKKTSETTVNRGFFVLEEASPRLILIYNIHHHPFTDGWFCFQIFYRVHKKQTFPLKNLIPLLLNIFLCRGSEKQFGYCMGYSSSHISHLLSTCFSLLSSGNSHHTKK